MFIFVYRYQIISFYSNNQAYSFRICFVFVLFVWDFFGEYKLHVLQIGLIVTTSVNENLETTDS